MTGCGRSTEVVLICFGVESPDSLENIPGVGDATAALLLLRAAQTFAENKKDQGKFTHAAVCAKAKPTAGVLRPVATSVKEGPSQLLAHILPLRGACTA
ncbi:hypothetical protein MTO96_013126 [Rhipicephalus appendiculatus]